MVGGRCIRQGGRHAPYPYVIGGGLGDDVFGFVVRIIHPPNVFWGMGRLGDGSGSINGLASPSAVWGMERLGGWITEEVLVEE